MTDAAPGRGLFLTFEGTDGSGKTTQAARLVARLRREGFTVVETVEPGGTAIGRKIRSVLLDPANRELAPATELLLYFASRAQAVHETIRPALERGEVVVSDRFTDSTLAYQGAGRGFSEEVVLRLHEIACGGLQPGLTIYLDIDLETGLRRAQARERDRMQEQSLEFHRKVREFYLRLAARERKRFRVIDASRDEGAVEGAVWEAVAPALEGLRVS